MPFLWYFFFFLNSRLVRCLQTSAEVCASVNCNDLWHAAMWTTTRRNKADWIQLLTEEKKKKKNKKSHFPQHALQVFCTFSLDLFFLYLVALKITWERKRYCGEAPRWRWWLFNFLFSSATASEKMFVGWFLPDHNNKNTRVSGSVDAQCFVNTVADAGAIEIV